MTGPLRSPCSAVRILAILALCNPLASPERRSFAYELNSAAGNIEDAIVESVVETPVSMLLARRSSCGERITLATTRNDNLVESSNDNVARSPRPALRVPSIRAL